MVNRLGLLALVFVGVLGGMGAQAQTTTPLTGLLRIEPDGESRRNSEGDIIRLKDGRLALVYSRFSGGASDHSAAYLAMRTSDDEGKTWSGDSRLLANEGGQNVMSVSLLRGKNDDLMLFYLRKDSPTTACTMFVRRSADELKTLGEPVRVTTLPGYHVVNNARVTRLKSGRILVPAALHTDLETIDTPHAAFATSGALTAYYSDDDGASWKRDESVIPPVKERSIVFHEPGVVELRDGRIMMYIRTNQGAQWARYSKDGGETWTEPGPTPLKSPVSPATIEYIPGTDALAAVWNDHTGQWPFRKDIDWRNPLCLAVSLDNGATWRPSQLLEGAQDGWFCYTSMTWTEKKLLLSYCAGTGRAGGLNVLKVSEVPLEWVQGLAK